MVQVIGEIGGSASRWAVLQPDGGFTTWPPKGERLPGFNPISGDGDRFAGEIRGWFTVHQPDALRAAGIHIYGAGCGSKERQERMSSAMRNIWPSARIAVTTDLHGAALGLCGTKEGLVLILGTGMNVGHFDGTRLFCPMPSLGYLLGDEGSGADIGRNLLQDAFHGRIPPSVHGSLFGPDGPVLSTVLEQVHRAPHPARELASYTALLAGHLDEPYVRELLLGRFHALAELIARYFPPDERRTVFATGSVAYGFRDLLSECLLDHGMTLTVVEPDPLPGLARYHQRQG